MQSSSKKSIAKERKKMRTRGSVTKRRFDVSANRNDQNQGRSDDTWAIDRRIGTSSCSYQNMQAAQTILQAFQSDPFVRTRSLSSILLITLIKTFVLQRWFQKCSASPTFLKLHALCIYRFRYS